MNKRPILKEFLKGDHGAVLYKNIDIEFIHGQKAVLSVRNGSMDGEIVEEVILSDYRTEEEMHNLFVKFGFEKLSHDEIEARNILVDEERKKKEANVQEEIRKLASMKFVSEKVGPDEIEAKNILLDGKKKEENLKRKEMMAEARVEEEL